MDFRRKKHAIDAVTGVINKVQEAWAEGKLIVMILMGVKGEFDHVSRNCLLRTTEGMSADGDQMSLAESFMSDRNMSLIINGHLYIEARAETRVPQDLPVSRILFVFYLSRMFREVEKEVETCTATSFADNCR